MKTGQQGKASPLVLRQILHPLSGRAARGRATHAAARPRVRVPPPPPQAIKNNAGFRVWVLFFLVMCSFSLLFLDWYDS